MPRDPLNVVAIAYERLCTFEFGIVVELFGIPRPEFKTWYRLRVASMGERNFSASGGIRIEAPYTIRALDTAGTIVVPGWRRNGEPAPTALLNKLRRAHADGARILSVCTGTFLLAEAGLLDGKRATTHWMYAQELADRYPRINVNPDVLYVDEGQIITSAGSAAGIDMGLHLIRRDFGAATANAVARRLVVPPSRAGGQKQFICTPVATDSQAHAMTQLLDDLRATLSKSHTIDSMAKRVHMSKRTFARRFKSSTGMTPHCWLQAERVRYAQELLESSKLSLARIATKSGFSDPQLLRLHFKRVVGTSPTKYRQDFRLV